MESLILIFALIFIVINVIQTWLIFTYKLLVKGGLIIGGMEIIEIPLVIYLIIKGGILGFLTIVIVEVVQWLSIAYFATNSKIR